MAVRPISISRAISHLIWLASLLGILKNEGPSPPSWRASSRHELSGSWERRALLPAPQRPWLKEVTTGVVAGDGQGTPHDTLPHRSREQLTFLSAERLLSAPLLIGLSHPLWCRC